MIGRGWWSYAPAPQGWAGARASKQARSEAELIWLLSLGGGIADRLLATVVATWSRWLRSGHSGLSKARPQLHAALHGRAFAALRTWLGDPALAAELVMIDGPEPRSLTRVDGRVLAELPFSWLVEVWAKGLTTVYGRFCLAADTNDGKRWRLTTIAPDLGDLEVVTVTLADH